jgi:hypothetical protein
MESNTSMMIATRHPTGFRRGLGGTGPIPANIGFSYHKN